MAFAHLNAVRYGLEGEEKEKMHSATALLKREIETKLAARVPSPLSPRAQQEPRLHPIGNARLDSLFGGGLPLGSVCELTGPDGSGRSSIALSLLAMASREAACAWIDVNDALSVHSAAAADINLKNLLWVRFGCSFPSQANARNTSTTVSTHAEYGSRPSASTQQDRRSRGEEPLGLPPTLDQMLRQNAERRRRKMKGTPGYPNQPLGLSAASQEQIEWERFNLRRVDEGDPLRQIDRQAAEAARRRAQIHLSTPLAHRTETKPWDRLSRALRAADQVLQSGGFRIVVLDLASCSPQQALRIPSATWFRFRRSAQESDAILLLLTTQPCARSSAACVVECSIVKPPRIAGVLASATRWAEVTRQRTGSSPDKKAPGRATSWKAAPAFMRAVER